MNTVPAESINPYAGTHPISADGVEVQAAWGAAEASLREFPYYLERYGDRARLFGASDGAWLATLQDRTEEEVEQEVLWLGTVLSSRGMPRLLLERHLELLHAELVRAAPDRAEAYAGLLHGVRALRERRSRYLDDAAVDELERAFEQAAGRVTTERLPRMGRILASAVADEADGLANAVHSVLEWAHDATSFPDEWLVAVEGTVRDARARVTRAH